MHPAQGRSCASREDERRYSKVAEEAALFEMLNLTKARPRALHAECACCFKKLLVVQRLFETDREWLSIDPR